MYKRQVYWLIISLRRYYDLDQLAPDELQALQEKQQQRSTVLVDDGAPSFTQRKQASNSPSPKLLSAQTPYLHRQKGAENVITLAVTTTH